MTSRENRKQRREAERKASKWAKKETRNSPAPLVPDAKPSQPHPAAAAYFAEMRAKADRELADEFGAEFIAHAREVSDRIATRAGLSVPTRNRAEANRQNAQLSTGPRTAEGKLASSRNSLKHGLASAVPIIPGEDPAEFETLRAALLREHQPADATEQLLVDQLAQSYWLLQRAIRFQNECFTPKDANITGGIDEKRLALFLRYGSAHERAFHKALNTLLRLKKDRRKIQCAPENGFVSQKGTSSLPQPSTYGFVSQINGSPEVFSANEREISAYQSPGSEEKLPTAA